MKLVIGLGNPGARYERTRHNMGFLVVDRIAQQRRVEINRRLCDTLVGEWLEDGEKFVLGKPQTFMNRSGTAVKALLGEYGGAVDALLVVYDDLDLPFGRLRIRLKGSAAGHLGIQSILENLNETSFTRVRVGIGRPPDGLGAADYVLAPFDHEEVTELGRMVEHAAQAVDCVLREGPRRAMELYN